ncbi:MAG: insulinase family protein [Eubacterium sp.]|nr:insulinase family protein [Eubacterium sp.]
MNEVKGYEIIKKRRLDEINADGYILEHEKTRARIVAVECEDENKVFSIGFRTPSQDSKGIAHIVEHTVLCGSDAFPVKDPFVELVKGSLNTFLNAMTYPDKTVYPVASCNDKDFQNLMHVYLDAVFHPNIYKEEKIFQQEGWHYELEDMDGELTYNGVVFNEMKGVFSSPEQILERKIMSSLYPDTSYALESGGDPECIPDLTYQEFLDFHSKYYHPSNSYIYLYGDMDMEEKLKFIDENYLSNYDYLEVDSELKVQQAFAKRVEEEIKYSVAEDESTEDKTYLSLNFSMPGDLDPELSLAFTVLSSVLINSEGAPIKDALIKAGIGTEILSSYEESVKQPYFSIVAKNANPEDKSRFISIIEEEIKKIIKDGINLDSVIATLNVKEFSKREANFGSYPKGLMFGLSMMDSWIYDDSKPFIYIAYNAVFESIRSKMDKGYFEEILQKYFIDNTHSSVVLAIPEPGLVGVMNAKEREKLASYKESLSREALEKIIEETKELKKYQDEPSSPEDLAKIPMLSREDIRRECIKLSNIEKEVRNTKVLYHDYFSSGIQYISIMFDIRDILPKYPAQISLFAELLGRLDTEDKTRLEYFNEVHKNAGSVNFSSWTYRKINEPEDYVAYFRLSTKVFPRNTEKVLALIWEAISKTVFDKERIREIVAEEKSYVYMALNSASSIYATLRAEAQFNELSNIKDCYRGVAYYDFICDLNDHFDEKIDDLIAFFKAFIKKVFRVENMSVNLTCSKEDYNSFEKDFDKFVDMVSDYEAQTGETSEQDLDAILPSESFVPCEKGYTEGIKFPSQVQYVARVGKFYDKELESKGYLFVLETILRYGYLWNEVRVKGGAYGVSCGFSQDGYGRFSSYRDPKLTETDEVYESVPEYLRTFDVDERELTKFVIGTMSGIDTPEPASEMGERAMRVYISEETDERRNQRRAELLDVTIEDIRKTADVVEAMLKDQSKCVFGGEQIIDDNSEFFDCVRSI